jgi:hypothetical protein
MAGTSFSTSFHGLDEISQLAEQFMQEQYAWGQQQFANNSQLTDQVVGDLMHLFGSMSGLGDQMMQQYNQYFVPEYQSLVKDAQNYASPARIQQAMGAAQSGVAQAFNGQRNAALADLQAFGIDPSSGRYAQLDAAERTQQAAAQAGAGFQAEQATEATGRGLRSEALQLGSVMPSQATAAYNAAQGAATAGENAKLANSQEGVNMMGSPTQWGGVGQQLSKSSSGPGAGGQVNKGNNDKSGNNNQNRGGGQGGRDSNSTALQGPGPGSPQSGGGRFMSGQPGSKVMGGSQGAIDGSDGVLPDSSSLPADWGMGPSTAGQDGSDYFGPATDSAAGSDWGPDTAGQDGSDYFGPATDSAAGSDWGPSTAGQDGSDYFGPANDSYTGDSSGGDTSNYDQEGGNFTDYGGGDGGSSDFSFDDSAGDYAEGGAIPFSKSPSHGRVTDDVPARINQTGEHARLNAGEFVMPRHTVNWLGEKFFQNLIEKSKQQRGGAKAKPSMRPAIPMRARS